MRVMGYVFDAYGTLLDVHSAVRRHAAEIDTDGDSFSELWRAKQLEYTWVRTLMNAYVDFWTITEQALDYALAKHGLTSSQVLRQRLLDSYRTLECYPEVPTVLRSLRRQGARIAILSNGTLAMLGDAVRAAGLEDLMDDVWSVDTIGCYKTHPSAYAMVTRAWNCEAAAVSFISSNRWDVAGAKAYGFSAVWINRGGRPEEYTDFVPNRTLSTLQDLFGPAA